VTGSDLLLVPPAARNQMEGGRDCRPVVDSRIGGLARKADESVASGQHRAVLVVRRCFVSNNDPDFLPRGHRVREVTMMDFLVDLAELFSGIWDVGD
jgi:hypothetical protein